MPRLSSFADQPFRFLLAVDSSLSMKSRNVATSDLVRELVQSGFGGQAREGDPIALWSYNQTLATDGFPIHRWNPAHAEELGAACVEFVRTRKYERAGPWSVLFNGLKPVIAASSEALIFVFTDGDEPVVGVPGDIEINIQFGEEKARLARERGAGVIALKVVKGVVVESKLMTGQLAASVPRFEATQVAATAVEHPRASISKEEEEEPLRELPFAPVEVALEEKVAEPVRDPVQDIQANVLEAPQAEAVEPPIPPEAETPLPAVLELPPGAVVVKREPVQESNGPQEEKGARQEVAEVAAAGEPEAAPVPIERKAGEYALAETPEEKPPNNPGFDLSVADGVQETELPPSAVERATVGDTQIVGMSEPSPLRWAALLGIGGAAVLVVAILVVVRSRKPRRAEGSLISRTISRH